MAPPERGEDRALVLTPSGRDAALAADALAQEGIPVEVCADLDALCRGIENGAGTALIASEALDRDAIERLRVLLATQPSWSDLPLIVLTPPSESAERNRRTLAVLARLGNVTTLERPVHALGMIAALRAALRARRRQYATRDVLHQLEDAVSQRERFLAILGHELRNPLGAIRNAVEIAQRTSPEEPRLVRAVQLIQRQSRLLDRLVDDLLDASRVTTGKIVLQRETVDIHRILRDAAEQLKPRFDAQRVAIAVTGPSEPLYVDADPARLEQILANLLANGAKYTPEGGRVTATVERVDAAVVVRVEDTGVGIAPGLLATIFDLFAQADQSIDRSHGGLGIGLTLAKDLAELHGGTLEAASEGAGRGSTFTLRLPLASAGAHPVEQGSGSEDPLAPVLRILVVEDNVDNRDSLRELLELSGHRVFVANDGHDGFSQALHLRPDVAIIDVGLPGMSGYELAKRLRVTLRNEPLLIALTGYGQPEDRRRSLDAGFDAHVTKPFDIRDLERIIGTATPREDQRAPSSPRPNVSAR